MKIKGKTIITIFLSIFGNCASISQKEINSPISAKTALLILDVQNDFFPGGKFELEGASKAASKGENILNYFRKQNLPVFHIQHVSTRKGATFFFPETPGVEFHSSHTPIVGESIIIKHTVNPFINTKLHEELKSKNVNRLVIFGMMTHMVVDSTVRYAFDLGFKEIIVISDACASRSLKYRTNSIPAKQVHESFLSAMGYIFAKVMTANDFINEEENIHK